MGFLLSPLLVLSRHIAQLRTHRLKRPAEREITRRLLAVGFYGFGTLIVVGLIGTWVRYCLGKRNPWTWAFFWLLEGRTRWSRPTLLVYWALLVVTAVAIWGKFLARPRKMRRPNLSVAVEPLFSPIDLAAPTGTSQSNGYSPKHPDVWDAADRHNLSVSLNSRRKSFHGLAVLMFVPGVIIDVCPPPLAFELQGWYLIFFRSRLLHTWR